MAGFRGMYYALIAEGYSRKEAYAMAKKHYKKGK
jgi:hypothetical protein